MKETNIQTSNGDLAVYQTGEEGPAILFLHGNSLSTATYRKQMESDLAENFRLCAFDLPGHGNSAPVKDPEKNYSPDGLLEATNKVIEYLKLDNFILVGHSLGGNIAIEISPELKGLKGILIFGTPPLTKPFSPAGMLPHPDLPLFFKAEISPEEAERMVLALLLHPNAEEKKLFTELILNADINYRANMFNKIVAGQYYDEQEILRTARIPVAVLQGEHEPFVDTEFLKQLNIPTLWKNKIHMIKEAAHCSQWEAPENFNSLLADFAREVL